MFADLKNENWDSVIVKASKDIGLVNCIRPGSESHYTILHGAARKGAPNKIVEQLIKIGAFRSLTTNKGEFAVDLARKHGHNNLVSALTPIYNYDIEPEILKSIESNFHKLIIKETDDLISKYSLKLPNLRILLELQNDKVYFPIPGMMGGVFFSLITLDGKTILNVQIESRMWGGADYYEVTSESIKTIRRDS